jgi:predicted hydrolase (HD superfamily)
MIRDEAIQILEENLGNKNMIKHCLASGAVMRGLARKLKIENCELKIDADEWEIAGLLHDADAEKTPEEKHGATVGEWVKDQVSEEVIQAMAAHNPRTGVEPQSKMGWALFAGEKLTGLVVATALVLPSKKLADVTTEMVLRRFKEPRFAAGAKRENILECQKLDLSLEEFVDICLEAMQSISDDLGL